MKGERPQFSMMAGGDLDGDYYFVCWDPKLIPKNNFSPLDYADSTPKRNDCSIRQEEISQKMIQWLIEYKKTDNTGLINHHYDLIWDLTEKGSLDPQCEKLVLLASKAVVSLCFFES